MTVCSTSNIRETRRDKIITGCCCNKFSEFESLESSDSEQRVKGEIQEEPGRQQEKRRKRVAGTVAHQSTFLETSLVVRTFPSVSVEAGTGLARLDCSSYTIGAKRKLTKHYSPVN